MIYEIDDVIQFSKRHAGKSIREIVRYDSGYIKDLMTKDCRFVVSESCFAELVKLTSGFRDNWEKPKCQTVNIFHSLKSYVSPYLYDFEKDTENVRGINTQRLERMK